MRWRDDPPDMDEFRPNFKKDLFSTTVASGPLGVIKTDALNPAPKFSQIGGLGQAYKIWDSDPNLFEAVSAFTPAYPAGHPWTSERSWKADGRTTNPEFNKILNEANGTSRRFIPAKLFPEYDVHSRAAHALYTATGNFLAAPTFEDGDTPAL